MRHGRGAPKLPQAARKGARRRRAAGRINMVWLDDGFGETCTGPAADGESACTLSAVPGSARNGRVSNCSPSPPSGAAKKAAGGLLCGEPSGWGVTMRADAVWIPLLTAAGIVLAGCDSGEKQAADAPAAAPASVGVVAVASRDVTPTFGFTGRVEAVDKVELRARVPGFVEKRASSRRARREGGRPAVLSSRRTSTRPGRCRRRARSSRRRRP